jgi:hypothetical protein
MKMSDAIKTAYEKKWSMVNNFKVSFLINDTLAAKIGGSFSEDINIHIKSFESSDLQNNPIETFSNNQWFMHNGHDQLYRFASTFKDSDNMSLYRKFALLYKETKESYFDDVKMSVSVVKESDWYNRAEKEIFLYEGVLVEAISNLALSNETENEIAEFTVNFRATEFKIIG